MPRWYARFNKKLSFIQHVNTDTWDAFAGVYKIIWETFLPRLFFGTTKSLSPIVGSLSMVPVKKYLLELLNPVMSAKDKYLGLQQSSVEIIWAVMGVGEFSNADQILSVREESQDSNKTRDG